MSNNQIKIQSNWENMALICMYVKHKIIQIFKGTLSLRNMFSKWINKTDHLKVFAVLVIVYLYDNPYSIDKHI